MKLNRYKRTLVLETSTSSLKKIQEYKRLPTKTGGEKLLYKTIMENV